MLKLLVLLLGCLPSWQLIEAAFLMECEGYIITTIRNPNQECSEYIHCAGDNSYYCNGDCDEAVVCNNSTDTTTPQSSVTTEDSSSSVSTEGTTTDSSTETTRVYVQSTTTQRALSTTTPTPTPTRTPTTRTTPTPINSSDPYVICRNTNQHLVFPYPANSNYYFECISKHLLLQQCPQSFCFDVSQGQCIRRNPYRL